MIFIVYMGGCCGDLVASILDWKDTKFDLAYRKINFPLRRQKLKKFYEFSSDKEKDHYVVESSYFYKSLPSHDIDYHLRHDHYVIGITAKTQEAAQWAARRFKSAHKPRVWEQVCKSHQIESVEQYANLIVDYSTWIESKIAKTISLEHILKGNLIEDLQKITAIPLDKRSKNHYSSWLDLIRGRLLI